MLCVALAAGALFVTSGQAWADSIQLFNTGVDSVGGLLAAGAVDSHYAIDAGSGPYVIGDPGGLGWSPNTATAQWISSAPGGLYPPDTNYTQTFTLGDNVALATATLSGLVAGDNGAVVYLNGNLLLNDSYNGSNSPWTGMVPFSAAAGDFQHGTNTLVFYANNNGGADGPGGLIVDGLSGSYAPVPEPATWGTALLAGLSVQFVARKRRTRA